MKREDEEAARCEFDQFLKGQSFGVDPNWTEVDQVCEPPDYFLELGDERFAVEVTGVLSQVEFGGSKTPTISVLTSSRRFVEGIERFAVEEDVLRGAYAVLAHPLRNFKNHSNQIRQEILRYIATTADQPSAPRQKVGGNRHENWSIQKVHAESNRLLCGFSPKAKWHIEVVQELRLLLAGCVETKEVKLANVRGPKILLILDRYSWADSATWRESVPPNSGFFHTVFRASRSGNSFPLFSKELRWNA